MLCVSMFLLCVCTLGHVLLFVTSWTLVYQVSLSMQFSSQEYWSGLPFPTTGSLPDPGIQPACISHVSSIGRRVLYHCDIGEILFYCLLT